MIYNKLLKIVIGIADGYIREQDVRIQTKLVADSLDNPAIVVTNKLDDHVEAIKSCVLELVEE